MAVRWRVHSILKPDASNDVKYEDMTTLPDALSLLWDTVALTVGVPADKAQRTRDAVKLALSRTRFRLIKSLRHVSSFIPASLP